MTPDYTLLLTYSPEFIPGVLRAASFVQLPFGACQCCPLQHLFLLEIEQRLDDATL